jgi:hypothetical protein
MYKQFSGTDPTLRMRAKMLPVRNRKTARKLPPFKKFDKKKLKTVRLFSLQKLNKI